jgi:serine/threonine protein kinase
MGTVYLAEQREPIRRHVALKVVKLGMDTGEVLARFAKERQALAMMDHPNIARIFDAGATPKGRPYFVMEYIEGVPITQYCDRKRMPISQRLELFLAVCRAVHHAHQKGVIHRDLKPSNVLVKEQEGTPLPKVIDFGIAKATDQWAVENTLLTQFGQMVGTPEYASPEQAEVMTGAVDETSDVYSLGVLLYELLIGTVPFEAARMRQAGLVEMLRIIREEEPPPLSRKLTAMGAAAADIAAQRQTEPGSLRRLVDGDLNWIATKALEKGRERRYPSVAELAADIQRYIEHRSVLASPPSCLYRARKFLRTHRLAVLGRAAGIRVWSPGPRESPQAPARSLFRLTAIISGAAILLAARGIFWWPKQSPRAPARIDWIQVTNFPDSVSQPALSPDGRMLTFIRGPKTFFGPGQIYIKTLPSGEPMQLTHDDTPKMSPAFSPDGSRIAYSTANGMLWDTWEVPVLGGEPRAWLPNASGLVWIGKSKLLFSEIKDRVLHMAIVTAEESRAGEREVYLPPHQRGMAHRSYPSPDGTSILVVEMNERGAFVPCRLLPAEGNSPGKQVGPPGAACTFAGWSPDGAWMYFSSNAGGGFHTWRQRFPDGTPEQITSGPTEEEGIAVAPDGRSLLTAVGLSQSSVWAHDSRGDRQISLEGEAYQPRFTPDGKKLLYRIRSGNSTELWVADLDSNRTEPLLPGFGVGISKGPGVFWSPSYDISPDGRQVVFFSPDRAGKMRLWLTPLDRRSPPRQIPGVEGEQPVFGPRGEIFFRRVEGSSGFLYSVREDGSGLRKVSDLPVIDVIGAYPEDRKWLLLGAASPGELIFPVGGGTSLVAHLEPPKWLAWTGDGKYLFVFGVGQSSTKAYALPLSPGQILPGIALAKEFPSEAELAKVPGARIIPAGDVVPGPTADIYAYTRESVQRNLYRIPLP